AQFGDHGQCDAGVAAGRLQDGVAGSQTPLRFGGLDHVQRGAILDAARWVAVFELRPQAHVLGRRKPGQPNERRAAACVEAALEPRHDYALSACNAVRAEAPPATAGRMVTLSPSLSFVSSEPRKRTSSSLTYTLTNRCRLPSLIRRSRRPGCLP